MLDRRSGRAIQYCVPVLSAHRAVAGVEACYSLFHSSYGNRGRQHRVHSPLQCVGRMGPRRAKVNYLPGGVYTGVRPTGRYNSSRLPRNALNCLLQHSLDCGSADLQLEATVWCAVVRHNTAECLKFTCRFASAYYVFLPACPFVCCVPMLQDARAIWALQDSRLRGSLYQLDHHELRAVAAPGAEP